MQPPLRHFSATRRELPRSQFLAPTAATPLSRYLSPPGDLLATLNIEGRLKENEENRQRIVRELEEDWKSIEGRLKGN